MEFDPPSIGDIRAAAARLEGAILDTPCVPSETLSAITGARLFLKFENLQFTASFKERGALNKLLLTDPAIRARGVCAMSAGNHAQGVAYHAKRLGVPATIVMPLGTPLTKIARTRDHGARVVIHGANLSDALTHAHDLAVADGLTFIHPYDDPAVIAGQGTIGLEILSAVPNLDAILVPIGGGGLISGIAIAAKTIKPSVRVIGVQSATYPSMARALAGELEPCADGMTIAEGIAVKTAGGLTREVVRALVDDILLVEESAIEAAVALLLSVEKTVAEGAGATGLAALLAHPGRFMGQRVATILTGGNIDLRVLASVAMRELVRSARLLRIQVAVPDAPGGLARLATAIGEAGANIVDVAHDRLSLALNAKGTVVEIVAEVESRDHGEAVLAALRERGFEALPVALR
ncbi:threonine ammonia-lyase [Sphingomonas sp.]|uniref:threonine ammonia-lyase n=1 Tax=Sphingomonas sp. TaxID=28214 RepID=UPI0025DA0184|nr:threonine ammonia-lyase [Sphingomonas sp.]